MIMMRIWLALAGIDGFMAVAAGAFGAHGVRDPEVKAWLHTGAQYQGVHAVAALVCLVGLQRALGSAAPSNALSTWAGGLFGLGGLVFGGSLYLLALTGVRLWGAVTPLGGLMLLAGWATVIWSAVTWSAPAGRP